MAIIVYITSVTRGLHAGLRVQPDSTLYSKKRLSSCITPLLRRSRYYVLDGRRLPLPSQIEAHRMRSVGVIIDASKVRNMIDLIAHT